MRVLMAGDEKSRLYHEIVRRTSEQVLLERMRLYGFWPANLPLPPDPPEEAAERQRIAAELAQLRRTQSKVKDPDKALAEERKRRWQESKKRRAERKLKREQERQQRRQAWDEFRQTTITHAGLGVSAGLPHVESDGEELERRGLPWLHTAADLAARMEIALSSLRWLTYHRNGATVVHYHRYEVEKKTGGARCISAPKPALKIAQQWVFDHILSKLDVDDSAHGFVPGRSILTNAAGHTGKAVVINLDMKEFFPSITFRRVKGLFRKLGYGEHVATLLALLCTEPPRTAIEVDGKVYHVALGQRMLPQGACTSPAITNALCRRLDRRLAGLGRKHNFTYTRYADDLTFSGDNGKAVGKLLRSVRGIVELEGFREHPRKTKVMRCGRRQEVTGLTVNLKPQVGRKHLRELRAILHNAAKHGLASQNRAGRADFAAYLRGRVEFVCMVDPAGAAKWRAQLAKALAE
ncbi:MAG: reverse transcriptase family protein [Gemmataceae bacterium]